MDFFFHHENLSVKLDISNQTTIDDALKVALMRFSEDKIIDLNPQHYEVYVAKKNG